MYAIFPLALALTAVAAPWGPNGGAGSRWGFQGLEWLPVAGGAHALPGSHAPKGGLPGGAGKAQVPQARERGFSISAEETSAGVVLERGLDEITTDGDADETAAEATATALLERGNAQITAADETSASALLERGEIQITAADEATATALLERGVSEITAADEVDANALLERGTIDLAVSVAVSADE